MPLYDYKCEEHGLFHELATLEDADKPLACPQCGQLSARIIMLAPELLAMNEDRRLAFRRNEVAQHQPIVSTSEYRVEQRARHEHKHGKGCGCSDRPIRKSTLMYTADGNKMFPSMRPWMISH